MTIVMKTGEKIEVPEWIVKSLSHSCKHLQWFLDNETRKIILAINVNEISHIVP